MPVRRARTRVLRVAVALALVIGTTAGVAAAAATSPRAAAPAAAQLAADPKDRKRALDQELAELRETLEGTSSDLVAAAVELRRSQAELVDARSALASAQGRLVQAQNRDKELAGQLAVAVAAQQKAARDLGAREKEERVTRSQLGRIAREAYLNRGVGSLAVALDAESPEQFADRVSAVSTALRTQNGAIDRLQVQQADTRARRTRLTAARTVVAGLKAEAEQVVEERAEATTAAAAATAQIGTVVTRQNQAVGVITAKRAGEQQRVEAMERESANLAAILAARARRPARAPGGGGSGGSVSDGGSTLSRPVDSPITSGFGRRYHPVLHYWRLHAGTDFGAPCGTPVRAAAAGEIVRAGWAGGYGNQLVIDHGRMRGSNIATSYNHLTRFVVRSGTVRRGQVVAYSGTTGLSTGCHLHFEVRKGGTPVNPMNWL